MKPQHTTTKNNKVLSNNGRVLSADAQLSTSSAKTLPSTSSTRPTALVKTDSLYQLSNSSTQLSNSSRTLPSAGGTRSATDDAADRHVVSIPDTLHTSSTNLTSMEFLRWDSESSGSDLDASARRLDFMNLRVHGRDAEIKNLQNAFDRIAVGHAEVVSVSGRAGNGKSTLVERALRGYTTDNGGFFARGKFDQLRQEEPYAAIMRALADVCRLFFEANCGDVIRDSWAGMGTDARMLRRLIGQSLDNIIHQDGASNNDSSTGEPKMGGNALTRLRLLCCSFLKAITSREHPLVLVLDDVHWADSSSMKLLSAFVKDTKLRYLLIVMTYREEESHRVSKLLSKLNVEPDRQDKVLSHKEIQVGPLQVEAVNEIIADILCSDTQMTNPLAKIVHDKTMGNVFHVLQYLESLQRDSFLSFVNGKWTWDVPDIQENTNVSDNVGVLLAEKIQKMSRNVQSILKLAACIGSRFDLRVLEHVVFSEYMKTYTPNPDNVNDHFKQRFRWYLNIGVNECLVEKVSKRVYKFSHDKVQSCLYSMIPEGPVRDQVHLSLGNSILELVEVSGKEDHYWLVFLAVEHLNRGRSEIGFDESKRTNLVKLNLMAANLALSRAAYSRACDYLNTCLYILDPLTMWETHLDMAIEVYSTLAETEYNAGNFEASDAACYEVMMHSPSPRRFLDTCIIRIDSLSARSKFRVAINLGYNMMQDMNEKITRHPTKVNLLLEVGKTRLMVGAWTDEDFLNLPATSDPTVIAKMKVLSSMAACAYVSGTQKNRFIVIGLRMFQLTVKHGITNQAPFAFAIYALINIATNRLEEGYRFGVLTLTFLDKLDAKEVEALSLATVLMFVIHWKRPLRESLPLLHRCYDIGRAYGDIDRSFFGAYAMVGTSYWCGDSLPEIEVKMRQYAMEMVEFKRPMALRLLGPLWQLCLNLMDRGNEDPVELEGEAIDVMSGLCSGSLEVDSTIGDFAEASYQMSLLYNFGRVEEAEEFIRPFFGPHHHHYSTYHIRLEQALVLFELYRKKKKRSYLNRACKLATQLEDWASRGVVNCIGLAMLLHAETLSVVGKEHVSVVMAAYDAAIRSFTLESSLNRQGTANERACEFLIARKAPKEEVRKYVKAALVTYHKWGAIAKVEWLERRYGILLNSRGSKKNDCSRSPKRDRKATSHSPKRDREATSSSLHTR